MKARRYKILVNYTKDGVSVSRSLYSGPHKKHADKAYEEASVLIRHGIMVNCKLKFFDGYRLREDWEMTSISGNYA